MKKTILVGVDGSPAAQRALSWGLAYAKQNGATIVAAHILTFSEEFTRDLSLTGLTAWRSKLRARFQDEWLAPCSGTGVTVTPIFQEGDTIDVALMDVAVSHNVELIVLGSNGHSNLKDRLLGEVPHKLTHRSDRPVVIVPADWKGPVQS